MKWQWITLGGVLIAITLLIISVVGCSSTKTVSPVVEASSGSWRRAWVEYVKVPGRLRATDMGPDWVAAREAYELVVARDDGAENRITLSEGAGGGASYALEAAPDRHALAYSKTGESAWFYVALDLGETPRLFKSMPLQQEGAFDWSKAPTTRDLSLKILKTAAHTRGSPNSRDDVSLDYYAGMSYAGSHALEDTELRDEYVRAYMGLGSSDPEGGTRYDVEGFHGKIATIARQDDAVRVQIIAGLGGDRYVNSAAALAYVARVEVAQALAGTLQAELTVAERPMNRQRVLWLTWALARLGTEIPLETDQVQALAAVIGAARSGPRPGTVLVRVEDATSGRLATLGIARAARSNQEARGELERIASGPCRLIRTTTGEVVQENPPLPQVSDEIRDLVRQEAAVDYEQHYTPGCWARATLASLPTPP